MSFENLKRNRDQISKLIQAVESTEGGGEQKSSYQDDRLWKPALDKAGNGYAEVRFLPAAEGQDLPWVRYWDHGFKGPSGQWYIEKSLTSIGQTDPVGELNSKLWNMSDNDNSPTREQARYQKRRLHYVSNVLVISDPSKPENNGKVFMYQYGKKIFDKIMDMMQPQFQDESPVNPFDFWEGANFKIKIRKVDGWVNYDKSEFSSPSVLGDDAELEKIYDQLHPIEEFVDPKMYKSYDELKQKLDRVLGNEQPMTVREQISLGEETPTPEPMRPVTAEQISSNDDEEEDTLSYFAKIANGD
jgi:hypothetical protein